MEKSSERNPAEVAEAFAPPSRRRIRRTTARMEFRRHTTARESAPPPHAIVAATSDARSQEQARTNTPACTYTRSVQCRRALLIIGYLSIEVTKMPTVGGYAQTDKAARLLASAPPCSLRQNSN